MSTYLPYGQANRFSNPTRPTINSSGARPIRVDDFHKKVESKIGSSGNFGIRPMSTSTPGPYNRSLPARDLQPRTSGMYLDTDEDEELRTNKQSTADTKQGDRYAAKQASLITSLPVKDDPVEINKVTKKEPQKPGRARQLVSRKRYDSFNVKSVKDETEKKQQEAKPKPVSLSNLTLKILPVDEELSDDMPIIKEEQDEVKAPEIKPVTPKKGRARQLVARKRWGAYNEKEVVDEAQKSVQTPKKGENILATPQIQLPQRSKSFTGTLITDAQQRNKISVTPNVYQNVPKLPLNDQAGQSQSDQKWASRYTVATSKSSYDKHDDNSSQVGSTKPTSAQYSNNYRNNSQILSYDQYKAQNKSGYQQPGRNYATTAANTSTIDPHRNQNRSSNLKYDSYLNQNSTYADYQNRSSGANYTNSYRPKTSYQETSPAKYNDRNSSPQRQSVDFGASGGLNNTYSGAGGQSLTQKLQAQNGYNYAETTATKTRDNISPSRINTANRYSTFNQYGSVTPQPSYDRYGGAGGTTPTQDKYGATGGLTPTQDRYGTSRQTYSRYGNTQQSPVRASTGYGAQSSYQTGQASSTLQDTYNRRQAIDQGYGNNYSRQSYQLPEYSNQYTSSYAQGANTQVQNSGYGNRSIPTTTAQNYGQYNGSANYNAGTNYRSSAGGAGYGYYGGSNQYQSYSRAGTSGYNRNSYV